jgi:hypothetical protein
MQVTETSAPEAPPREHPRSRSTPSRSPGTAKTRCPSARRSGRAPPTPRASCANSNARAAALPRLARLAPNPTYAVCARERLTGLPATATGVTAADVFA